MSRTDAPSCGQCRFHYVEDGYCRRFPLREPKHTADWCGEFSKRVELSFKLVQPTDAERGEVPNGRAG